MRSNVYGLPLILLALLFLAGCSSGPSIVIEPPAVDLGDIPAVGLVSAVLQVQNPGKAELQITDLRTSCGCTQASVAKSVIESGGQTELTIVFDPEAHPGLYGPLMRMVYLQSNDPNQPELEIPIQVNILPPDELAP